MGIAGLIFIVTGIVAGFAGTFFIALVKNSKRYFDFIIRGLSMLSLVTTLLFIAFIETASKATIFFLVAICGFGLVGN